MTETCLLADIKLKCRFISRTVEVMQNAKSFCCVKRNTFGTEIGKMRGQIRANSCKICPCFLNIFLGYGYSHILFLSNAVCTCGFIQQHIVILDTIAIKSIMLHGHKDRILKIRFIQSVIVDSDLSGSSAVKAVE